MCDECKAGEHDRCMGWNSVDPHIPGTHYILCRCLDRAHLEDWQIQLLDEMKEYNE